MLLASFAGEAVFAKVKDRYLEQHKDVFLNSTLRHVLSKNLPNLIDGKTLHEWREILTYCVTYSNDGGKQLALELGRELLQKRNDLDKALICFMVANDFGAVLDLWNKKLQLALTRTHYKEHSMLVHKTLNRIFAQFNNIHVFFCKGTCEFFFLFAAQIVKTKMSNIEDSYTFNAALRNVFR